MRKEAKAIFVGLVTCAALAALATPGIAFVSEEEAFYSTVLDVYLPCDTTVQLYPIYDRTTIRVDFSNDGIYDETYEMDQLKELELDLLCGAHIHADKPVMAMSRISGSQAWTYAYVFGNPNLFTTDYYVLYGDTATISPLYPDTTVQIDKDNDGTWDTTAALVFNVPFTASVQTGSKIHATKPVQVLYSSWENRHSSDRKDFSSVPPYAYEYFTPYEDIPVTVLATKDYTTVNVDTNTDGISDQTFTLNSGETKDLSDIPTGSKIYSTKHILVGSHWRTIWDSNGRVRGYYDIYQSAKSWSCINIS